MSKYCHSTLGFVCTLSFHQVVWLVIYNFETDYGLICQNSHSLAVGLALESEKAKSS